MIDFSFILDEVPDYKTFFNVDELNVSSDKLVKDHSDLVKLIDLGESSGGEPIKCLKIGEGKHNALIHGFPNPEEPLGGVLLEFLSQSLVDNKSFLKQFDYSWYIIKCVDPDGARLNERSQKGPFTPKNFALNYYRTPTELTGEMTFPYMHGDVVFNNTVPETRALMNLLDKVDFDFVSSLHNMKWGGISYQVSEACPEIYSPLQETALENGIMLRKRLGTMLARGVQLAAYFTPARNYKKAKEAGVGPLEKVPGAFVFEYASLSNPNLFMMIPECCFWYDPRLWDDSPSNKTLSEVVEHKRQAVLEGKEFFVSLYEKSAPLVKKASPFSEMLKYHFDGLQKNTISVHDPEPKLLKEQLEKPVSIAVQVGEEGRADLYRMWYIGAIVRMLDHQISLTEGGSTSLNSCRAEAIDKIEEFNNYAEKKYDIKAHPIKNLVKMCLGSILYSMEYSKSKRMWNRTNEDKAKSKMV